MGQALHQCQTDPSSKPFNNLPCWWRCDVARHVSNSEGSRLEERSGAHCGNLTRPANHLFDKSGRPTGLGKILYEEGWPTNHCEASPRSNCIPADKSVLSSAVLLRQELRGSALRLLATGLAPSPRSAGARSKHWPSIRVALEGLGLSGNAVAGCKQFLLQVRPHHSFLDTSLLRMSLQFSHIC